MDITCSNCETILDKYLCDIPSVWRKSIVKAICMAIPSSDTLDCTDIKPCETITTFSEFRKSGSLISITFRDERNRAHILTMDLSIVLDSSLDDIDPMCLATEEEWAAMTNEERYERLINHSCNCT